jgi:YVTN family beta-propeller protein
MPAPPSLHRGGGPQRLLTTVLFTDIVGSTERAAQLGDRGWKELVDRHHAIVRQELRAFHGRELDTAGDGFFASFDRPAQAIECATAIIDDLRSLDLRIRAAIHMGEVEVMGDKVGGITVHVASRALALAGPDEILVTRTVREVAAGADVTFSDRGVHEFKGVPEEWDIYAVEWRRRELPSAGTAEAGAEGAARRRPGRQTVAAVALLGAGLLAVAAWAMVGRGAGGSPPVPVPDSAIRVDAGSDEIVDVVPAGSDPTGIAIDGGSAWVISLGDTTLTGIPVAGGPPSTRGLPGKPTGIAAGSGSVWVTFGYGATGATGGLLLEVSEETRQTLQQITVKAGANAVALDGLSVWLTNDVQNTLTRIDPGTQAATAVTVGEAPTALAIGDGSIWVANAVSRTIWRLDAATMTKTAEVSLTDAPTAVALGFGRLWVTSYVGNSVVVIDAASNGRVATIPLDQGPRGIAAGPDAIWVAGSRNALLRIDPGSLKASGSIDLPGPGEGVAVLGPDVWVTVQK